MLFLDSRNARVIPKEWLGLVYLREWRYWNPKAEKNDVFILGGLPNRRSLATMQYQVGSICKHAKLKLLL